MLHVRSNFRELRKPEGIAMTRFLHNALGLAVALGTGGLMVAMALV